MTDSKLDLVLIVGGGPAGFGAALAFHNTGYTNIIVLEGRPDVNFDEENSYAVGINVRGKNAINNLFGSSPHKQDPASLGLRVDQWKIIVGPGINVANFDSGLVTGTSRAGVTQFLYDETQKRNNSIQVLFGYRAKSVDLKEKTLTCETQTGEEKSFKPTCLIVCDGYRSKTRDQLAQIDKTLKVTQWNWNDSFRVLISDNNRQTQLNPYIHYIQNRIYISKFLNGRWSAVLALNDKTPKVLTSNELTEENVNILKNYVKKMAPPAFSLFTDQDYRNFFSRAIFTGAVTKVSKLVINDWAVLLGDAAHSTIPATGEGINSALEDCFILQQCLESNKSLKDSFNEYEKARLEDVNALSDIAYAAARPNFKSGIQMLFLSTFNKCNIVGPTKEDLMFGKNSSVIKRYTDITKVWKQQTAWLGGPNLPKS